MTPPALPLVLTASGIAASITLADAWAQVKRIWHPEPFTFEAVALGDDMISVSWVRRFPECGCTAQVWADNGLILTPHDLTTTVYTPEGCWSYNGRFEEDYYVNAQYYDWDEPDVFRTLREAEDAARAQHLDVCREYQQHAGPCENCGVLAVEHVSDLSGIADRSETACGTFRRDYTFGIPPNPRLAAHNRHGFPFAGMSVPELLAHIEVAVAKGYALTAVEQQTLETARGLRLGDGVDYKTLDAHVRTLAHGCEHHLRTLGGMSANGSAAAA
ncbi:hypothetical protein [Streptomyces scabiei]|uniref:hypothetical protein n=1 Tax=Streptomyces scabiei TaxID=1930 RepID=UPI000765B32C|nr:hypothetical protein [Streptomyces scabiei]